MKRITSPALILSLILAALSGISQVSVNSSGNPPHSSAGLEVDYNDRGFLPPRMTTAERNAIATPAEGLIIYNTTTKCTNFFIGSNWQELCGSCTPVIASPTEGIHVPAENQIVWNWNAVSGAAGYKWSTTNNYAVATDVGTVTTYTQTGLSPSTPYTLYVWAYNVCGPSTLPAELSAATTTPPCLLGSIGPAGGRIFYCGAAYPGYTGLEAAPSDQSTSAPWGCQGTLIPGADGSSVGAGKQNTLDIINVCSTSGIAARICDQLDLNGYTDWFLPSGGTSDSEQKLIHTNLYTQGLGGFANDIYWSSTERDAAYGKLISFPGGDPNDWSDKSAGFRVRCVHSF